MSLPSSRRDGKREGGRGNSDGHIGKRKGGGSTAWHVMSCVHCRHRHVIPIRVVAIESARERKGGKRRAVTDMSARWRDILCTRHHHHCVIAIKPLCRVLSPCHCRREGKRVRKRGEGAVMDTLQFVEVARQVKRVKDIKCDGNVSGSEQKQLSEYAPYCPVLAALVSCCIPRAASPGPFPPCSFVLPRPWVHPHPQAPNQPDSQFS